jgi:solute carrier family 25 carnitine/acylcarnitine transporter 20/29
MSNAAGSPAPEGANNGLRLSPALKNFIAGGASGIACILASQPLDTVKTRLQSRAVSGATYTGGWDCFVKTIRNEGPLALYKGMMSPLLGIAFVNAVAFAAFGAAKRWIVGNENRPLTLAEIAMSGSAAGLAQAFVASPIEMIKVRLQIQNSGAKLYSGPFDCARKIVRESGVRGLFRGLGATMLRDFPAFAAWYGVFEFSKRQLSAADGSIGHGPLLLSGASAGVGYWLACYPIDVAKTMLQTQRDPPKGQPLQYRHALDVISQVIKSEGVAGLFRGFGPTLVRALPASGSTFLAYEAVTNYLQRY